MPEDLQRDFSFCQEIIINIWFLMLHKEKDFFFPVGGKMIIILQLTKIKFKSVSLWWSHLPWITTERYEFYNLLSTSNKFNCMITVWRQKTCKWSLPYEFGLIFHFLPFIVLEIFKVNYEVLKYKALLIKKCSSV